MARHGMSQEEMRRHYGDLFIDKRQLTSDAPRHGGENLLEHFAAVPQAPQRRSLLRTSSRGSMRLQRTSSIRSVASEAPEVEEEPPTPRTAARLARLNYAQRKARFHALCWTCLVTGEERPSALPSSPAYPSPPRQTYVVHDLAHVPNVEVSPAVRRHGPRHLGRTIAAALEPDSPRTAKAKAEVCLAAAVYASAFARSPSCLHL